MDMVVSAQEVAMVLGGKPLETVYYCVLCIDDNLGEVPYALAMDIIYNKS